jgi:hypothetical protein
VGFTRCHIGANVNQRHPRARGLLSHHHGGTNDIYQGVPIPERLALIDQIAATVHARNVILSSVAPYNPDPAAAAEWNAVLEVHATAMGWSFIDPWMNVRTPEQTWVAGADYGMVSTRTLVVPRLSGLVSELWLTSLTDAEIENAPPPNPL